jgi:outer membrane protein assembly factor BamB
MVGDNTTSRALWLATASVVAVLVLPAMAQPQAVVVWQDMLNGYSSGGVTVSGGSVFVSAGPTVYAVDAGTGIFRWNASVSGSPQYLTTPVVAEGVVVAITNQVTAWNATTGSYLWTSNQPTAASGPSVSIDLQTRTVYVSVQASTTFPAPLIALSLDTGLLKWQGAVGLLGNVGVGSGPPVVAADRGMVCVSTSGSYLICYNVSTGTVAWSTCVVPGDSPSTCATSWLDTSVYYGCGVLAVAQESGSIYAYDVVSGASQWNSTDPGYVSGFAVVSDCVLYIGASGLTAYDMRSGAIQWNILLQDEFMVYPVMADGNVLVATYTAIYMANKTTGALTVNVSLPPSLEQPAPQVQYFNGTAFLVVESEIYAFSTSKTLPVISIDVCADAACQSCPDQFDIPAGQCAANAGGSVMRQCAGNDVVVTSYADSSTCTSQSVIPITADYTVGLCYPLSAGGYIRFNSCG